MPGLFPLTYTDLLAELDREIETRKRVFPRWVEDGKITRESADHRIACMEEIRKLIGSLNIAASYARPDDEIKQQVEGFAG